MQLLETHSESFDWGATVYRQSRLRHTVGSLLFAAIFAAIPVVFWKLEAPRWLIILEILLALFVLRLSIGQIVNVWKRSSWTLAVEPSGLWINLRSFHNSGFEPGLTVLKLEPSEIESARVWEGQTIVSRDARARIRSLELTLAPTGDTAALKEAIDIETHRQTPPSQFLFIQSRGRVRHVPVRLVDDQTLRIAWSGPSDQVTPSVENALRDLSRFVTIDSPVRDEHLPLNHVTSADIDDEVLDLVASGRKLEAIRLLRKQRRLSLREAKETVEGLLTE